MFQKVTFYSFMMCGGFGVNMLRAEGRVEVSPKEERVRRMERIFIVFFWVGEICEKLG